MPHVDESIAEMGRALDDLTWSAWR
jgi:hypothetical protein